jgi:hypothetical protein
VLESAAVDRGCLLTATSVQAIATASTTLVQWNASPVRDDGGFNDSANDQIVVPSGAAGWYHIWTTIQFESSTVGNRIVDLELNASTYIGRNASAHNSSGNTWSVECSGLRYLSVGDAINVNVFQSSGGDLDINGVLPSYFGLVRMGRFF